MDNATVTQAAPAPALSARWLAAAGAGPVELQQAGRWESPSMSAHYARSQLAARGAVARLRHGAQA